MSHTPWTQEQAEKWADEYCERYGYFPHGNVWHGIVDAFTKAAEMIEAAPTLYGETTIVQYGREVPTGNWTETRVDTYDTHSAKLVGVRPIESDGSDNEEEVSCDCGLEKELAAIEKEGAKDEPNQR